jgi:two-component system, NtrC family, response regulator AtoC
VPDVSVDPAGAPSPSAPTGAPSIPPARARVLVVSCAGRVARYPLTPGARLVVGRARSSDVVIAHASVSRTHCVLLAGDPLAIEDAGSRNGTSVAGRRIAAHAQVELPAGTAFGVGDATLLVHPEPSRPPPPPPLALRDATMTALRARLELIASSALPVLVLGETGTGKELVAEELHARSPRAGRPMLRINCAAVPDALLESELFGYDKGAFTGASSARGGLFEAADGGTLFLDELGEMSLAMQAKLLRVLDRGEILRLGSVRPRTVDVRLIGATHRALPAMVAAHQFREDLYYRLDGFVVELPPLRARLADLPVLAEHLLDRIAARTGGHRAQLSAAALDQLARHAWPGNVRELRAVLERAVVLAGERALLEPPHIVVSGRAAPPAAPAAAAVGAGARRLDQGELTSALAATAGNQRAAARLLGVSRPTLIKYIERFGLGRPRKR